MNDRAREDRSRGHTAPARRARKGASKSLRPAGTGVCLADEVDQCSIEPEDRTLSRVTQPLGSLRDRLEDRLKVCWRARDDPEDLARRGLAFAGFRKRGLQFGDTAVFRGGLLLNSHSFRK